MSKKKIETITSETINNAKKTLLAYGDGKVGKEIYHMLLSGYRLLYIQSHEEDRVIRCFQQMSVMRGYNLIRWDCSRGLCDVQTDEKINNKNNEVHNDPNAVLSYILDHAKSDEQKSDDDRIKNTQTIYFLLDFHHYLNEVPPIERQLKEFSTIKSDCYIVIISPVCVIPPTLEKLVTLIDFPLPSLNEILTKLEDIVSDARDRFPKAAENIEKNNNNKEEVIKAVTGLTLEEAENAFARSLVDKKIFDIPTILSEKKQIIKKSGVLEYIEPHSSFADIGGLDTLKEWLIQRKLAFREDALEFGLPSPKGILVVGTPGCGKSFSITALAHEYEMPLVRLDMGSVFKSYVGESEKTISQAIKVIESIAPCVTGDTRILLGDGEEVSAYEIFNEYEIKKRIEDDNSVQIFFEEPVLLMGYNPMRGVDEPVNMNSMVRRKNIEKLIKITIDNGESIKVTPDHKLCNENGYWEKAKDLTIESKLLFRDKDLDYVNFHNISGIERVEIESYVYDPCCVFPHTYIANGFINHNCICWVDEVEKGLGGVQSSNNTDGGVTSRVFGTMLTWLNEKTSMAFVAATANNVLSIPPEFMRAGRFDEIFFLDLPDFDQRCDVLEKLIIRKKRDPNKFNLQVISQSCDNYSPAELEKAINNALFVAYADGKREMTTQDIITESGKFQPLYNTRREEIEAMREWALGSKGVGGRARLANSSNKKRVKKEVPSVRKIDLSEDEL